MGSHAIDLITIGNNFGTAEMRALWDDKARIQKHLDTEAALALAEGKLGLIPQEAAEKIAAAADVNLYNIEDIAAESARLRHSLMGTINALERQSGDAGEYVHFGATTQDIVDTGMMLQVKDAYAIIERDVHIIMEELASLAKAHQDTVMIGRTHGMHALPTTFGFKVAVWLDEFIRHAERLAESKARIFVGNMNGAVGTYASFGPKGAEVETETMAHLGLNTANIGWQSARDRFSEFGNIVALISGTAGKIGNEFYNLMRTDIGEIEEPFTEGEIGSSTMPHKRNPALFEGLASLTPPVLKAVSLLHESMGTEHERDAMHWRQEWVALPEISIYISGQLSILKNVLDGLTVRKDRMAANLDRQAGLIMSEKVMFELSDSLGKQTAHAKVYKLAMTSFEQGLNFGDVLKADPEIAANHSDAEIDQWLNPSEYTGLAHEKVDQVLNAYATYLQGEA
ncbi:adenylosuccinate lyase [Aerococcus agrisoli]|uniref:Adenylosuccinate lyase n=1 Tax=Aerococcus agrisoli TaxID=2487350 RepID=A0A3N4GJU1_9LACT|nr:adenylosuccinate lyase [Aerococcus agrisoli]RPA62445.1 adenylosuccinate lyase [Aerococcus agrisoli]